MKNLQILMMCCFLVLLTACGREGGGTAQTPVASEEITESITQMPDEQESEAMPENMELGLTVNGVYYPIPISLKQLTDDGWKISGQTPYFLEPFVGEEYYETRADWSLSKDGQEILPGGSIIRLLEKDGVLLEVTITNQVSTGSDTPSQKIEDGVVDSMALSSRTGAGSRNSSSSWLIAAGMAPYCSNQCFATAIRAGVSGHSFQLPKGR